MRVCENCGHKETINWRGSRFDFNAEYIRYDEALNEPKLKHIHKVLEGKANFWPWREKYYTYYRRGKEGLYLYRVPHEDYKVHRERKKH